jgi:hypothetical protein
MTIGAALVLAACQAIPNAQRVASGGADEQRVAAALAHRPMPSIPGIRKSFYATVHLAGIKSESPGTFEYHGPRDFRITAIKATGEMVFDVRLNWAGVSVLQIKSTLPKAAVEMLATDIAHAFETPISLDGLEAGDDKMVLERRMGDGNRYRWIFDRATGELMQEDVDLGLLDTLHIYFRGGYSPDGWPREVEVSRRARVYDVLLRFTD